MNNEIEMKNSVVLGQKYAYATVSLVLGIFSFVHFLGLEKAVMAVVFGWLALRAMPEPELKARRAWAKAGMFFGIAALVIVPVLIIANFDRLRQIIEALAAINGGR